CLAILPIFDEHHGIGATHGNLSGFAGRDPAPALVDHCDFMARDHLADCTGTADTKCCTGTKNEIALGLSIDLVDGEAELFFCPVKGLTAKRLARSGN